MSSFAGQYRRQFEAQGMAARWPWPQTDAIARDLAATRDERDRWIRLFNRLEAAISHHKKGKSAMFVDEVDDALYAARDRILRDAAQPRDKQATQEGS